MKVRKLSLVLALVVLSAMLLAAPVQAGRTHISVTFQPTETAAMDFPNCRWTGPVLHCGWLVDVPTLGNEPEVTGTFSLTMDDALVVYPNAHSSTEPGGPGWGPITGTWQLVTAEGAWEGRAHMFPMYSEVGKFPKSWYMKGSGNGTGA